MGSGSWRSIQELWAIMLQDLGCYRDNQYCAKELQRCWSPVARKQLHVNVEVGGV